MTQDVSTPDEHNPAEVPQAPEQAAHIMDQVLETQAPADGAVTTDLPSPLSLVDDGVALLKSGAQAVESEVRKVVAFIEHSIVPAGVGPRTVEAAQNLPFAAPGETLFEAGEHLLFRAFRDVGDEVRHIYLNEFGNHVKA